MLSNSKFCFDSIIKQKLRRNARRWKLELRIYFRLQLWRATVEFADFISSLARLVAEHFVYDSEQEEMKCGAGARAAHIGGRQLSIFTHTAVKTRARNFKNISKNSHENIFFLISRPHMCATDLHVDHHMT
jgi:hypothetical protein